MFSGTLCCLKMWSIKHQVIDSREAKCYGIAKDANNVLGMSAIVKDAGLDVGFKFKADSSAAKRIAGSRDLGKVQHIELAQLWLED